MCVYAKPWGELGGLRVNKIWCDNYGSGDIILLGNTN